MKVEKGVKDIKELIPFMNRVFHKNFPTLLPKLYTSNKYASNHYYIQDNGKIVGALASIPNTLHVYDDSLIARGIGMVSCHKKYRGKGIMSSMLKQAIVDAKAENVDFMYLSGDRQRYENYGFVPCGYRYIFTLNQANFRHMSDSENYTFVRIKKDSPYIEQLTDIYNSQSVRYTRDDFLKTIKSWNIHKVYAILDKDNNLIGHLATKWYKIVDFKVTKPQNTAYIVKAFAKVSTKLFGRIDLYPDDELAIESMSKYSQEAEITTPASFKILNFRHVISALLNKECAEHKVQPFSINIEIKNVDSFNVQCQDNKVTIGDIIVGQDTFTWSEIEATRYLFAPYANNVGLPFDLKIFVPVCDNV